MSENDIQRILKKYESPSEDAQIRNEIRRLDKSVERAFLLPSLALGIIGLLVLGSGMALYMSYGLEKAGILVGLVGLVLAAVSVPLAKRNQERVRHEVGGRILTLAEKLK